MIVCLGQYQVPYRVGTGKDDVIEVLKRTPIDPPVGANDVNCKVTDDSPPVILVHGTFENQNNNWGAPSPLLHNEGRCPWTFNYGKPANGGFMDLLKPLEGKVGLGIFKRGILDIVKPLFQDNLDNLKDSIGHCNECPQ